MTVPQWKPTDQASASKLNELADSVSAALDPSLGQNPPPTTKTLVEIFELTEDITYPDSGDVTFPDDLTSPPDVPFAENCKRIWLKNASNTYITLGSDEETVYFPTITEFTQGDSPEFTSGDRVAAVWNAQSGRWEVVGTAAPGDTSIWVELKTKMPSSGSVAANQSTVAHPRDWSGSAWVTDTDAGREITIYDTLGKFRGRGKDDFSSPHNQGSIARVVLNADNARYEIRDMTPHALWIRGLSDAAWTTPSTLDIAASAVVMQPSGAIITHTDPAVKIPVNDVRDWEGASGVVIEAFWDESTQEFKARMVPCT